MKKLHLTQSFVASLVSANSVTFIPAADHIAMGVITCHVNFCADRHLLNTSTSDN